MKVETDIVGNIKGSPIEKMVILVIMYVETFNMNVIKISPLTCFIFLVCHGIGDPNKLQINLCMS